MGSKTNIEKTEKIRSIAYSDNEQFIKTPIFSILEARRKLCRNYSEIDNENFYQLLNHYNYIIKEYFNIFN